MEIRNIVTNSNAVSAVISDEKDVFIRNYLPMYTPGISEVSAASQSRIRNPVWVASN